MHRIRRAAVTLLVLALGLTALPAAAAAPPRIPRHYLAWYKAAARTCRALS